PRVMVTRSLRRKKRKRSFTRRLIERRLSSEMDWPPTRRMIRSGPASTAGRDNRVLRLKRAQDILLVKTERRDLSHRKFREDDFVLRADQVHLPDLGNQQHLSPDALDIITQLPLCQPICGEGIDVTEDIAEAVVEGWFRHARRELRADVFDHVSHP